MHHRGAANECPAADDRLDEPAFAGLDIAPRDRCEVERKPPGERSLRRQAIAGREPACGNVAGDRVRDGEIAGAALALKRRGPRLHCGETLASEVRIDCTVLLWDRSDIGRLSVHYFSRGGEAMT